MNAHLVAFELRKIIGDWVKKIDTQSNCPETQSEHLKDLMLRLEKGACKNSQQENRWIGYVQGVLITMGICSVAQMKELNKSK